MANLLDNRVILVVDDEEDLRQLLSGMLRRVSERVRVIEAPDGKQALDRLRETPTDLVVLDLDMPIMNGYEVIEKMRSQRETKLIPILVLTAFTQQDAELEVIDAGANDFLGKPIPFNEFLLRVRALVRVKLQIDEVKAEARINRELVQRLTSIIKREVGIEKARQILAEAQRGPAA
jgi:DNA-binding response OmpR family regulator